MPTKKWNVYFPAKFNKKNWTRKIEVAYYNSNGHYTGAVDFDVSPGATGSELDVYDIYPQARTNPYMKMETNFFEVRLIMENKKKTEKIQAILVPEEIVNE
jgi:hypothetical protein